MDDTIILKGSKGEKNYERLPEPFDNIKEHPSHSLSGLYVLVRKSFFYAKNWTIGSIKLTMRFFFFAASCNFRCSYGDKKTFPSPVIIMIYKTNYVVKSCDREKRDTHVLGRKK